LERATTKGSQQIKCAFKSVHVHPKCTPSPQKIFTAELLPIENFLDTLGDI